MWWCHARLLVICVFSLIGAFTVDHRLAFVSVAMVIISVLLGYNKDDGWEK